MHRFLATPGKDAYFDFISNTLTLRRLPAHEFWRVQQSMKDRRVFSAGGPEAQEARRNKAELVHEVTHFIDATTSLWGLEYNARKTMATELLLLKKSREEEWNRQMRVFMLNTAEVDAHVMFLKKHQPGVLLSDCTMHHRVIENETYGPVVIVEYHHNGKTVLEVPVSMLAMLEAHAYANEMISRIADAEDLANSAERTRVHSEIEKAYAMTMDQAGSVEYTMLLHLMNRGFPELELRHRLRLFSAIVRLALNADAFQMSTFAQSITSTFRPSQAAVSTIRDMCRGTSRAVLAFKAILCLDSILSSLVPPGRAQIFSELEMDCVGTLRRVLTDAGLLVQPLGTNVELANSLGLIQERGFLHDRILIPQSVHHNRAIVERLTCAEAFDELTLPDAVAVNGKASLRFPNRIDVNLINVPREAMMAFVRLHEHLKMRPAERFFA